MMPQDARLTEPDQRRKSLFPCCGRICSDIDNRLLLKKVIRDQANRAPRSNGERSDWPSHGCRLDPYQEIP